MNKKIIVSYYQTGQIIKIKRIEKRIPTKKIFLQTYLRRVSPLWVEEAAQKTANVLVVEAKAKILKLLIKKTIIIMMIIVVVWEVIKKILERTQIKSRKTKNKNLKNNYSKFRKKSD